MCRQAWNSEGKFSKPLSRAYCCKALCRELAGRGLSEMDKLLIITT